LGGRITVGHCCPVCTQRCWQSRWSVGSHAGRRCGRANRRSGSTTCK